jgi:NADPH:quinone reductase-like Zn-dependent oxidoreductase
MIMAQPTADVVGPLAEQAASGSLKVHVASVLPLEQATDGLGALGAGSVKGKVVVNLDA